MTTETSTLYKLIVLYMLNHADSPLTNATISDLILAKEYTNYFSLQRAICELETSDLVVAESADNSTHYRITEEGRNTLSFFEDKISDAIKKDIIDYFNDHQIALKQETSVIADFYKGQGQLYNVRCQIKEDKAITFEVTFQVSGREQAQAICKNWKRKSGEVYDYLMDMLIQ